MQKRKRIPVFVHSPADAQYLKNDWGLRDVVDHPLCYITDAQRHAIVAQADRKEFPRLEALGSDIKLIGTFGFLNEYKGFDVAIKALQKLPANYHLAIFGGMHPGAQMPPGATPHIVEKLQKCVMHGFNEKPYNTDVSDRVHFMGQLDDQAFLRAMSICDIVAVPYFEVGQSSSGPLSMAVDMRKRVVASRTKCFRSYGEYNTSQVNFFDIGNVLGLAQEIETSLNEAAPLATPRFNADTNAEHYRCAITDSPRQHVGNGPMAELVHAA